MNKTLLIFAAGLLFSNFTFAQTPNVTGFTKVDVNILAVPAQGTVMPANDGGYFMSKGLNLTKYDSSNTIVWTQSLLGTVKVGYTHAITSICDDGQGGAIVTGQVHGTLRFGSDSLPATYVPSSGYYSTDAFIARISSTGKIWWNRMGEISENLTDNDIGVEVKVSGTKVYWLASSKGRNVSFNGQNYPSNTYGSNKAMLVQFGLDGTVDWVNMTKGGGLSPRYLAVNNGNVFYSSFSLGLSSKIDFGNNISLNYQQGSYCLVKFNNTGAAQWVVTYDNDNLSQNIFGLSSDDEGNTYVTGQGSSYSTSYGIRKGTGYLVKISGSDGAQVWTRILSNGELKGPSFSNGKIYVSGNTIATKYLQSNATDSIEIKISSPLAGSEQFVAAFDKLGTLTGSLKAVGGIAGGTMDHLRSNSNRVIMMGTYSNNNAFGSVTIPNTGGNVGLYHIGFFNISTGSGPNGLENITNQSGLSLYPNPAKEYFLVEIAAATPILGISLFDISGKKVMANYDLQINTAKVNTTMLNRGIYLVEITTASGVSVKKIIID